MVVGRDAVLIKHEGKKSFSHKCRELEKKGKWDKVSKKLIERANKEGGQNAIESE